MAFSLRDIADRFGLTLQGDGAGLIEGVCSLQPGMPGRLSFLADPKQDGFLAQTVAGAVVLAPDMADRCPVPALIADNPQLAYARVAALFLPPPPAAGVHPSAIIDSAAQVDEGAAVGPRVVIEAGVSVATGTVLSPGCVLEAGCKVGPDCRIGANAVLGRDVRLGARVRVEAGAVIGGRGFGLARDRDGWVEIPQLGGVRLEDDVEVGAGCTIDRGTIGDTLLERGVKLDDQVHIAHNCRIGALTVIAGCTGVAGSTQIGARCMIGGGVGIGDHLRIVDDVILTGATQVPSDITAPGIYSSTLKAMPAGDWRRRLALIRKLDRLEQRLRALEKPDNDKGDRA